MAAVIQPSARELFATAGINWLADDIVMLLVDVGYVYDVAHDFLDDVGAATRVATSSPFTGKTADDGILDANDPIFTGLTGDAVTGVWILKSTGVESTSPLIFWFDQDSASQAISYTPDGSDVKVILPNGTNKIGRI